jgi:hypothetical protein
VNLTLQYDKELKAVKWHRTGDENYQDIQLPPEPNPSEAIPLPTGHPSY